MKIIQGDLIQLAQAGKFDMIAHGCNCFCEMGAGIAKTIKATFPEAYRVDCTNDLFILISADFACHCAVFFLQWAYPSLRCNIFYISTAGCLFCKLLFHCSS